MKITQEQLDEFIKCKNDIVYFAENYIQHLSIYDGVKKLELHPYQIQVLEDDILTAETSRQIGFSACSYIKILHTIIFHTEKTIVFYNATRDRASHSIQSIATLFDLCTFPEILKPILTLRNKGRLGFDNGVEVMSASHISHLRGYKISDLYLEEVDYYETPIEEILHTIFPRIAINSNTKIWAWSCPYNGNIDKVKKTLEKLKNHNHYNHSWYVIPDRDSKWKNRAKEIVGE